jgi:glycosyltransferase involved in cell wall biosynthesis
VYPPVDVDQFELCREKEDFYVTASRLVPYKRVDLLVQAFNAMPERKLVVIGDGPERKRLEGMAGPNVTILGHVTEERLRRYMQTARAFLFAAEEDFGIVAVEAQACGTPVIAFCKGGATETVVPGVTGLFFDEQTLERVVEAVLEFESFKRSEWDPAAIRANAERFSTARFCEQFRALVESEWLAFSGERAGTQWNRGLGTGAAEGEWAGNADVQAGDPDSLPIRIAT